MEVKTYSRKYVRDNDKILFNVNNVYDKQPDDYWTNRIFTKDWLGLFHKDVPTIVIDETELEWMKKAKNISQIRSGFPRIFNDELESSIRKHAEEFENIRKIADKWFIRTENYSFKYTPRGAGPYTNLRDVFKSLVYYVLGHENVFDSDTSKTIYFIPWLDLDYDKEFRIFVYNNKITAISSQHLYEINTWLASKNKTELQNIVDKILLFFERHIKEKMSFKKHYVMDLALIGSQETPYFIEPNDFGAEYGSGSSLFHWVMDHDLLHGKSDKIELRFVDKE